MRSVEAARATRLRSAYADSRDLETRRSIYRRRVPALDLPAEAIRRLSGVSGLVADVGCGSGAYARRLRQQRPDLTVLGLDRSPGMAAETGAPAAVADAMALPLPDACCGGVLSLHMLYHVPDPSAALAELARVRRPDGVAVIATNAADDKAELFDLARAAVTDVTGEAAGFREGERFRLEDGARLASGHFGQVSRVDFVGEVVAPVDEVVAFLDSAREFYPELPYDAALERVTQRLAGRDSFRFTSHVGLLICR